MNTNDFKNAIIEECKDNTEMVISILKARGF